MAGSTSAALLKNRSDWHFHSLHLDKWKMEAGDYHVQAGATSG